MYESLFHALALWPDGVIAGQWWRLWTGHLAHVDARHLALNMAAMLVLLAVGKGSGRLPGWAALLWWPPLLSLGLMLLRPDLAWYAGLSGLLWAGVMRMAALMPAPLNWTVLPLLVTWILVESALGSMGRVPGALVEAHAIGALLGLLSVAVERNSSEKLVTSCTIEPKPFRLSS